jgi:hypothetical protein
MGNAVPHRTQCRGFGSLLSLVNGIDEFLSGVNSVAMWFLLPRTGSRRGAILPLMGTGWAFGTWGSSPWGGFEDPTAALQVQGAYAVGENRVRISYTVPVAFRTGLSGDAAFRKAYTISTAGGVPNDGKAVRAVMATIVELVDAQTVDVWLDRPMSPHAAIYTISASGVTGLAGEELDEAASAASFLGLRAPDEYPIYAMPASRDVAHPDTLSAQLDPLPDAGVEAALGGIPTDATGDYATDEGVVSYKKRVWRRILARKNGYSHLPGYGAGLLQQLKKLARPSTRQQIASDVEVQILQEPETIRCRARFYPGNTSGLWRLQVLAQTKSWGAIKMERNLFAL